MIGGGSLSQILRVGVLFAAGLGASNPLIDDVDGKQSVGSSRGGAGFLAGAGFSTGLSTGGGAILTGAGGTNRATKSRAIDAASSGWSRWSPPYLWNWRFVGAGLSQAKVAEISVPGGGLAGLGWCRSW